MMSVPHQRASYNISEGYRKLVPLAAGGIGAAVGQSITCPLDVVQTRLQSSNLKFNTTYATMNPDSKIYFKKSLNSGVQYMKVLVGYMKHMIHVEGTSSLFKGLVPGLCGIVPAKSIYFCCYTNTKNYLKQVSAYGNHFAHGVSALLAGTVTATLTNPIWYIKTQQQLNAGKQNVYDILRNGYRKHGTKAFFRGLSASYVGVSEVIIYFMVYEDLKSQFNLNFQFQPTSVALASLSAKMTATVITYPHEVVRTRLRQDERDSQGRLKYRQFVQTLALVAKDEGLSGLYGGFATGLMRQLPNTVVVFLTYETITYMFQNGMN